MPVVGTIVGPHGLRGQLKIQPATDFPSRFAAGNVLTVEGREYLVETSTFHKGRPLLKLKGVDTIEAVEALKWKKVEAAEERPELGRGEFLVRDLLGLRVVTEDGRVLGTLDEVQSTAAHDLLVVGTLLIPGVREFVRDVDLESRTVTVRLIPGMLDDAEAV